MPCDPWQGWIGPRALGTLPGMMRLARPWHALVLFCTLGNSQCPGATGLIQSYGYTEVRPPSTFLMPGTLVTFLSKDPLEAKIICGAEASLGPRMRFKRSLTSTGTLKRLNNKSFTIDAGTLKALKERQQFRSVAAITVTLSNASIVELSDDEVLTGMWHRSPACAQAVRQRVERGYTISMISSALIGDVTYSIAWEQRHHHQTGMAEKTMAMVDLAAMLEGEIVSTTAGEIKADGLVWGIRDDEYLSALAIPYVEERNFERGTRHIPVEHVATLDPAVTLDIDDKVAVIEPPQD